MFPIEGVGFSGLGLPRGETGSVPSEGASGFPWGGLVLFLFYYFWETIEKAKGPWNLNHSEIGGLKSERAPQLHGELKCWDLTDYWPMKTKGSLTFF